MRSVSEKMGESGVNEEMKSSMNQSSKKKPEENDVNNLKGKKPVIKKNKLDLRRKQKAMENLKKSKAESLTSSKVNKMELTGSIVNSNLVGQPRKARQIWPNKTTFQNLLLSKSIRFLKKDMIFVLKDFGAIDDCLYQDRFNRFLYSNVWEP